MEITEIIQRLESDMLSHKSESYTTVNQFNVGLHHGIASYIESLLPKLKALSSPSSSAGVEAELDSLAKEKDYWYNRCFQAEAFIDASPFDPGMTPEQIDAYRIWLESKKR